MSFTLKKAIIEQGEKEIVLDCPHCRTLLRVTPIRFRIGFTYRCDLCGGEVCLDRERVSQLVHQMNAKLAGMKK
ncbi:MAG: hypothetical protein R2940_00570 [Syntrophotaleaceae bacterium]